METGFVKRIVTAIYSIVIIFIIVASFGYSNQDTAKFYENYIEFDKGWFNKGIEIGLPYDNDQEFVVENTLPQVYGDQYLVMKCYYDNISVYIDGVEVYRSLDNYLFGRSSNVGKKEAHVLLKPEYSGKKVEAKIQLQHSLYGAEFYDCYITTRSGYGIITLKKQMPAVVLFVILVFSGIWEMLISIHFIIRKSLILRMLSFEALFFAGLFSLLSGIWLICGTRLPLIIWGNNTGFAILEIVTFLLMPLAFLELIRAVNFRVSLKDNILDGIVATSIALSFILCLTGVIEWGNIVVFGHLIDIFLIFLAAYYSYTSLKEEKRKSERKLIAAGNCLFLLVCVIALGMYINNIDSDYNILVIIGLIVYISTQVSLIYRRIGLKVEEEAELVQVKELAYTDELTKLTNRRYFYEEVKSIEDRNLSPDTTVVYFDLNRLKYYNDTLGHDAGDELIVAAADCIRKAFSDNSTSVISRMGGDEFVAMFIASEKELKKRLEHFYKYTAEWKGKYVSDVSVSVGVASLREYPNATVNELCKYADDKMYYAKKEYYAYKGIDRRKGH